MRRYAPYWVYIIYLIRSSIRWDYVTYVVNYNASGDQGRFLKKLPIGPPQKLFIFMDKDFLVEQYINQGKSMADKVYVKC